MKSFVVFSAAQRKQLSSQSSQIQDGFPPSPTNTCPVRPARGRDLVSNAVSLSLSLAVCLFLAGPG